MQAQSDVADGGGGAAGDDASVVAAPSAVAEPETPAPEPAPEVEAPVPPAEVEPPAPEPELEPEPPVDELALARAELAAKAAESEALRAALEQQLAEANAKRAELEAKVAENDAMRAADAEAHAAELKVQAWAKAFDDATVQAQYRETLTGLLERQGVDPATEAGKAAVDAYLADKPLMKAPVGTPLVKEPPKPKAKPNSAGAFMSADVIASVRAEVK